MNTPPQSPLLAIVPSSDNLSAAIHAALPTLRRPRYIKMPFNTPLTVLTALDAEAPGVDGPVLAADATVFAFDADV